jgi:glycosyltransferase involved in cell wall biosynthesis
MNAQVAIVVRSRGDAPSLERAVASVRAQTSTDWALALAVDDGDDVTAAERLAKADERLVVVRAAGLGALANAALAAVPSELAVLHDDDGTWHPDFLARTVAYLDEHPDDMAVATRSEVVVDSLDPARPELEVRRVMAPDEPAISLVSLIAHNYVPPVSLVFRRSVHERLGGYDEALPALEDWEFLLRLVAHGPVGFLADEPLAAWHLDPDSDAHPDAHDAVELRLRDSYLRRDLQDRTDAPSGLGAQLSLAHQLRRIGKAHQDHLDVVTTDLRLELGRLRGEHLMMRETLTELQEDFVVLNDHVQDATARMVGLVDQLRAEGRSSRRPSLPTRAARRVVRRLRRGIGGPPSV